MTLILILILIVALSGLDLHNQRVSGSVLTEERPAVAYPAVAPFSECRTDSQKIVGSHRHLLRITNGRDTPHSEPLSLIFFNTHINFTLCCLHFADFN